MMSLLKACLLTVVLYYSASVFVDAAQTNFTPVDYFPPAANGGTPFVQDILGDAMFEPTNVIVSGLSDFQTGNVLDFLLAMGLASSSECGGLLQGNPFPANLGDGTTSKLPNGTIINGTLPIDELRNTYGSDNIPVGVCLEILAGDIHARVLEQNGSLANSGAFFIATSVELGINKAHTINPAGVGGYDEGRDILVERALLGGKSLGTNITYNATAQNITGLIANGTVCNHNITTDGIVTLLTVSATLPS